jgi:NTP pyrophosphatase (non-canonical NTP hydrolase)
MTIFDLQEAVHKTAVDKGWYDEPRSFGDLIALVHSELSEALEAFRETGTVGWTVRSAVGGPGKPEGAAIELADAIIRILDMAEHYGVDMQQMLGMKMEYNKTRPFRHGGKAI